MHRSAWHVIPIFYLHMALGSYVCAMIQRNRYIEIYVSSLSVAVGYK